LAWELWRRWPPRPGDAGAGLVAGERATLVRDVTDAQLVAAARDEEHLRALVQELPRRAAFAVDNARLFRDSEARRLAAEALASLGSFLGQALDPDVVARRVTESVRRLFGLQTAILYRIDPATEALVAVAAERATGATPPPPPLPPPPP